LPLAFLLIGIIFLVAAVRGLHRELFAALKSDFTGPNNFIYWVVSLWAIVAIGYFKPLRPVSNGFLALVVLVLLLQNRGFFDKFMAQIRETETPQTEGQPPIDPVNAVVGAAKSIINKVF
jgi:hypothetical protein